MASLFHFYVFVVGVFSYLLLSFSYTSGSPFLFPTMYTVPILLPWRIVRSLDLFDGMIFAISRRYDTLLSGHKIY